jgi:DNA processing protein
VDTGKQGADAERRRKREREQEKGMTRYDCWFAALQGVSRAHRRAFLADYDPEILYHMPDSGTEVLEYFTSRELACLRQSIASDLCKETEQAMEKHQITFCSIRDPEYPQRLRYIPDPPLGLFIRGSLPPEDQSAVAVAGARMCSEYGRTVAAQIGRRLAEQGIAVISGLALGIDSASHAGALQGQGYTCAVLGSGTDICYPRSSRALYDNILQSGGGIVSEYPPGAPPERWHFPERNRIISGLADTLVVVEAKARSGSLITADQALEQGRDVFAVPGRLGDALSEGCFRLVEQGAGIVYSLEQLPQTFNLMPQKPMKSAPKIKPVLEKEESLVYSCLDLYPKNIRLISEHTGLNRRKLLEILNLLKEKGLIREDIRNYYTRLLT